MRKLILFLCLLITFSSLAFVDKPSFRYEGASRCSLCHSSTEIGDQYGIWVTSPHHNALADLSSEKGKTYAEKKGITDPSHNPACLSCHLTGYGTTFDNLGPLYQQEDGVGCESCHGAGGGYAFFSIMYEKEKAITKGLISQPELTCVRCHDGKSHDMPPFVLDDAVKKFAHPIPSRTMR